jgi:hypothetical protein
MVIKEKEEKTSFPRCDLETGFNGEAAGYPV